MIQIVAVNGFPGSGKTTWEHFCQDLIEGQGYAHIISSIDFVKEIAKECGWNGEKSPANRKFLADLKALLSKSPWGDVPLQQVIKKCKQFQKDFDVYDMSEELIIVFVDVREPENLKVLKEEYDALTVLIRRPGDVEDALKQTNSSDKNILDFSYDLIYNNDNDIEYLHELANEFVNKWIPLKKEKGINNDWLYR